MLLEGGTEWFAACTSLTLSEHYKIARSQHVCHLLALRNLWNKKIRSSGWTGSTHRESTSYPPIARPFSGMRFHKSASAFPAKAKFFFSSSTSTVSFLEFRWFPKWTCSKITPHSSLDRGAILLSTGLNDENNLETTMQHFIQVCEKSKPSQLLS